MFAKKMIFSHGLLKIKTVPMTVTMLYVARYARLHSGCHDQCLRIFSRGAAAVAAVVLHERYSQKNKKINIMYYYFYASI